MIRFRFGLATIVLALAGCAGLDSMVNKASDMAVARGTLSSDQAAGLKKTSAAFRKSAEEISESEEYYIGRSVAAQVLSRYKTVDDPKLHRYLQAVLQVVAMSSDRPVTFKGYHVQVLAADEMNAFAAPGGFVFVTTGLLKKVENEDQLACVLAHEVAHVARKHGLKTIKTARLTSAFTILGTEAAKNYTNDQVAQLTKSFEGSIDDIVGKLVVDGYSRDKEFEADRYGALFASHALYHPGALPRFLGKLEGAKGGGLLKTHPAAEDRIAALQKASVAADASYKSSAERTKRFAAFAKTL
jgi:predicted Zn-dependent protease